MSTFAKSSPQQPATANALASDQPGAANPMAVLEAAMSQLIEANQQLLELAIEHRRALAAADLPILRAVISRQNEVVQQIARHEQTRQEASVELLSQTQVPAARGRSAPGGGGGGSAISLKAIATIAAEPTRSRLLALGARLRDLLTLLHREHSALRCAADSLSTHMQGLMRQAYGRLSHAGTYGRAGHVDSRVQVISALDLRL